MRSLMTGRNWLLTLLITSVAFNIGFGATFGVRTYRRSCGRETGSCGARQAMLSGMELTAEQRERIAAAEERLLQRIDELRQQLTAERESLVHLLTAVQPDRAAIAAQLDTVAEVQRRIQQQVAENLLEERSFLSSEQERTYNDFMRSRLCPLGCDAGQGLSGCRGAGLGHGHGPRGDREGKSP